VAAITMIWSPLVWTLVTERRLGPVEKSYSADPGGRNWRQPSGTGAIRPPATTIPTTFKRDWTPIPTRVNLTVKGDRAYFRTYRNACYSGTTSL
jgi:hypothetical protein